MGRLFWKFFLFFWLAQVLTAAGVGLAVWWATPAPGEAPGIFAPPPPPRNFGDDGRAGPPEHSADVPRRPRPPPQLLLPALVGSLVSLMFAALLAWHFARPIRILRNALADASSGQLGIRVGQAMAGRYDELSDLGRDFDHMASRLGQLIESQRRLLHDVSHELRSPLARLQIATDLMQQQPERGAELIDRIARDTARIDSLVGQLLSLARLDGGAASKQHEVLDLSEMLHDMIGDSALELDKKACRIKSDLPDSINLRGNAELLFRAVGNVLRNAIDYSPKGGEISVFASQDARASKVLLRITDQGPGVAPADLGSIFEPFFRAQAAPANTGYGLGLAMSRRIIEAHGGSIEAANLAGGGFAVTISLPTL